MLAAYSPWASPVAGTTLRVPLGEDSPADAELLDELLHELLDVPAVDGGPRLAVTHVERLAAARAGAQSYLVKGRVARWDVRCAIRHAVERQRLTSELRRAMSARDDVLSIVSHDPRYPLGRILAAAQTLMEVEPAPSPVAQRMIAGNSRTRHRSRRVV